ncbi:hypothetical protein J5U22_01782 [Saccharolobus shibatae]|uniref:Uncharacterized protein n=1 Tax=Saccharolobus shibatae TaxID=2286 RepID=A0A8F5BVH1_9CREN|nr:hypothetical protein J5U21_01862 [Saccharolobus shibatae]QXJ35235.1 hypothetical protein J5U22_01782 [Saccharolobus shibatae]
MSFRRKTIFILAITVVLIVLVLFLSFNYFKNHCPSITPFKIYKIIDVNYASNGSVQIYFIS